MARHEMTVETRIGRSLSVSFSSKGGDAGEMTLSMGSDAHESVAGPLEILELRDFLTTMISKYKIHHAALGSVLDDEGEPS